jgi:hypothetical protein
VFAAFFGGSQRQRRTVPRQVAGHKASHRADAGGRQNQRGNDRSIPQADDVAGVEGLEQFPDLPAGDLRRLALDNGIALAAYRSRRIQHYKTPTHQRVKLGPVRNIVSA